MSFYNHCEIYILLYINIGFNRKWSSFPQSLTPQSLVITEAVGKWDSYSVFCNPASYLTPKEHKYPLRDNQDNRHSIPIYLFSLLPRPPPRADLARPSIFSTMSLHFSYRGPPSLHARNLLVLGRPTPGLPCFHAPCPVLVFMFGISLFCFMLNFYWSCY